MATAIVTGSGGLVGSESVSHFVEAGYDVIGLENDMRSYFFGPSASTSQQTERLLAAYPESFRCLPIEIRDAEAVNRIFSQHAGALELVIHTAAQPSHDWAATEPLTDFTVNANGTLNLLEATRLHKPDATFIFTSTNKVYGDKPNFLPLVELGTRFELPHEHEYYDGIPITMSIDHCLHSLFGASKAAADLLVQEYGRYFDMPTVAFRGGCLTGPNHAGARLHGFLSYLMRCTVTGEPYTVYGYGAKQVRDNIHSADLVRAFAEFHADPRAGAVYNIGGGRESNCSMLEAIALCEQIAGRELGWDLGPEPRIGDHRWWISDLAAFKADYPDWQLTYGVEEILREIHEQNVESWSAAVLVKLSIVIPAHNEAGSIAATVTSIAKRLDTAEIDYEIVVVDDGSSDATGAKVQSLAQENSRVKCHRSHNPLGFGYAVRAGLDVYEGDAVAIVMGDGSDSPEDIVRYYYVLLGGYDCAFGSRFVRGAQVIDYPRLKLSLNRLANLFIRVLFRHGYNDTTNAFKAYRRDVIETAQPLLSNHFNLTVELPLKAFVRGHSYKVVPISWTNRSEGVSKLKLQEMGSRYLFIVLYVLLERHLSRGDYHRSESLPKRVAADSRGSQRLTERL